MKDIGRYARRQRPDAARHGPDFDKKPAAEPNWRICARTARSLLTWRVAHSRHRSGSMRLREKVAQQLPLRRKHTGRIMDDYAFLCIYASRRNALNSACA